MLGNFDKPDVETLMAVLSDRPADSPEEVFRRCKSADTLASMGAVANEALPYLLKTLVVRVRVDCALALRVSAAAAIWKVSGRVDVVLPFLTWALKDEYWGVAPRAVEVLSEIGRADVVPELIRLAERRLDHGPFHFEEPSSIAGAQTPKPFPVTIAHALGRCGRGESFGRSFDSEAKEMLAKLANCEDQQLREAALKNLHELNNSQN